MAAREKLIKLWGIDNVNNRTRARTSTRTIKKLLQAAKRCPRFESALGMMEHAIVDRVFKQEPGIRKEPTISTKDLKLVVTGANEILDLNYDY